MVVAVTSLSLPHLSERPFRAPPGGSLLEFPRPRSSDRGALVSSSFPSRQSLGGFPAPPVKSAPGLSPPPTGGETLGLRRGGGRKGRVTGLQVGATRSHAMESTSGRIPSVRGTRSDHDR